MYIVSLHYSSLSSALATPQYLASSHITLTLQFALSLVTRCVTSSHSVDRGWLIFLMFQTKMMSRSYNITLKATDQKSLRVCERKCLTENKFGLFESWCALHPSTKLITTYTNTPYKKSTRLLDYVDFLVGV